MSAEKPKTIKLGHAQPGDTVYYVGSGCIEKIEILSHAGEYMKLKSSCDGSVLQLPWPKEAVVLVFTNYWDAHRELTKKKLDRQK